MLLALPFSELNTGEAVEFTVEGISRPPFDCPAGDGSRVGSALLLVDAAQRPIRLAWAKRQETNWVRERTPRTIFETYELGCIIISAASIWAVYHGTREVEFRRRCISQWWS
jgi:hypothetical protein